MRLSAMLAASAIVLSTLVLPAPAAVAAPPVPEPSLFTPVTPVRVLDTRANGSAVGPGATITLELSRHLPEPATAVVLNITGTGPTAATFITAFPYRSTGATRPVSRSSRTERSGPGDPIRRVSSATARSVTLCPHPCRSCS